MPTLITLSLVVLVGAIAYCIAKTLLSKDGILKRKAVTLSPRFSLNPKEHLLRDRILLMKEHLSYDDLLWHCLFSREGDVYIERTFQKKYICWEHFAPNGDSQEQLSWTTVHELLHKKQIGRPIRYFTSRRRKLLTVIIKV